MLTGCVFDIKEFALNDGPGIRLTVFLKGCPLRCLWCHNPEGMSFEPQLNLKTGREVGTLYTPAELIAHIRKFRDVFETSGGGVTFSGGEPTAQNEFLLEVLQGLEGIHRNLDTSGFCDPEIFSALLPHTDLVFFDLKLINEENHLRCTGVSNKPILANLKTLSESSTPYHIRIPLIPELTDTAENLDDILRVISTLKNKPLRVDLLPYNKLAGAKYPTYGMEYALGHSMQDNNTDNIRHFQTTIKEIVS